MPTTTQSEKYTAIAKAEKKIGNHVKAQLELNYSLWVVGGYPNRPRKVKVGREWRRRRGGMEKTKQKQK